MRLCKVNVEWCRRRRYRNRKRGHVTEQDGWQNIHVMIIRLGDSGIKLITPIAIAVWRGGAGRVG